MKEQEYEMKQEEVPEYWLKPEHTSYYNMHTITDEFLLYHSSIFFILHK